jgi:hypothetical protein
MDVLGGIAAQLAHETLGAGARDGAEIVGQLAPAHADAVVRNGERVRRLVWRDQDLQQRVIAQKLGLREARVAQPVAGVRCVRDQLAQKDLAMLVERVDDQIENPADFGLERLHGCAHGFLDIPRSGCNRRIGRDVGRSTSPFNIPRSAERRSPATGRPRHLRWSEDATIVNPWR